MKKIIGILGVAVIAMVMFFNTNAMNNSNSDVDLASLVSPTAANAEGGTCVTCGFVSYDVCVTINYRQYIGYRIFYNC